MLTVLSVRQLWNLDHTEMWKPVLSLDDDDPMTTVCLFSLSKNRLPVNISRALLAPTSGVSVDDFPDATRGAGHGIDQVMAY